MGKQTAVSVSFGLAGIGGIIWGLFSTGIPLNPGSYLAYGQFGFIALIFALLMAGFVLIITTITHNERLTAKDRDELLIEVLNNNTEAMLNIRKEIDRIDVALEQHFKEDEERFKTLSDLIKGDKS